MQIFKNAIGIIPARLNSKRLKNKNFRSLNGKPLYSYSTNIASKLFPTSYFSTDCHNINQRELPSNVILHPRSSTISNDDTEMRLVLKDIINAYSITNSNIVLLQPTSPLRNESDIIDAYDLFTKTECSQVMSISGTSNSILKYGFFQENIFKPISSPKYLNMNDQSLPKIYRPNGSFYIFSAKEFINSNYNFPNSRIVGYETNPENSIDINTAEDFSCAESIISGYSS